MKKLLATILLLTSSTAFALEGVAASMCITLFPGWDIVSLVTATKWDGNDALEGVSIQGAAVYPGGSDIRGYSYLATQSPSVGALTYRWTFQGDMPNGVYSVVGGHEGLYTSGVLWSDVSGHSCQLWF